ncbi:multidrug efflux MFS transporter [Bacillaceae bacterium]
METWRKNLYILVFCQFLVMAGMSLIMPFLPLYIQDLGIRERDEVTFWAGIVFGANFFTAFLFSPFWGSLADRYGRKIMILRSGFGMAIIVGLTGFATNVYHLLLLRLLNGVISGFIPASIALVATNTPKEHNGYALGLLQSGAVAGSIMGPFFGGLLAEWIGFRGIFFITGTAILLATLLVWLGVRETFMPAQQEKGSHLWRDFRKIYKREPLPTLFGVGFFIQFSLLNSLPLLPVFVQELQTSGEYIAFFSGLVTAVTGLANMLASPKLGKLGDRWGAERVLFFSLLAAAFLFVPHAFVGSVWQLLAVRFLLGFSLGGLLPAVNALVRRYAPKGMESRTYGYSNSAVFLGNMLGPIFGGYLAAFLSLRGIFLLTSAILLLNALWVKYKFSESGKRQEEEREGNLAKLE